MRQGSVKILAILLGALLSMQCAFNLRPALSPVSKNDIAFDCVLGIGEFRDRRDRSMKLFTLLPKNVTVPAQEYFSNELKRTKMFREIRPLELTEPERPMGAGVDLALYTEIKTLHLQKQFSGVNAYYGLFWFLGGLNLFGVPVLPLAGLFTPEVEITFTLLEKNKTTAPRVHKFPVKIQGAQFRDAATLWYFLRTRKKVNNLNYAVQIAAQELEMALRRKRLCHE